MEETLTLTEAGRRLGVDEGRLRRLIRTGNLPEAQKVRRREGLAWVLPVQALTDIAEREGLTIDVREGHPPTLVTGDTSPPKPPESMALATASETSTPIDVASDPVMSPMMSKVGNGEGAREVLTGKPTTPTLASLTAPNLVEMAKAASQRPKGAPVAVAAAPVGPTAVSSPSAPSAPTSSDRQREEELRLAEIVDTALLDRLLGAHEEKAEALARGRQAEETLLEAKQAHKRTAELLEVERRERTIALERFRQEQTARYVADAKVTELRDQLVREVTALEAERQQRQHATQRSLRAEREAATAVASMGWISRRRYQRVSDQSVNRKRQ